ncbi:M24 family metallopeptidase [Pseudoalteromonas luteoviolacea]|uniref:Xaa-pro aminopeptidase n=1 Tax=Pseudoalteromonas luteoviolacea (strain 2ta16) TaxID=1353533 RepID=V4JHH5_PSEL2|nr:M24 family metallopeptidase [Pseudoalteromonas luteoviolacea]ESP94372.1 Xaa-pro aminopeptidase [Pseudoalteromonas luteoviolacea 2ta16]KZN32066.1 Xaa-Pro aminopeptidase [Pseudoalteromonas luteoviolacea NCIMB 1944]
MYKLFGLLVALCSLSSELEAREFEQGRQITEMPAVLTFKERVKPINNMVSDRLDNLLPKLMQEADLDMWLVINREYGEDKLFYTLVPQPTFAARRTTLLVFSKNPDGSVERFSVSRYPIGELYPTVWKGGSKEQQWQRLAEVITKRDPKRIGINISENWALADGLSVGLHKQLRKSLPKKYQNRLVSAENLVLRWLETRSEKELNVYPQAVTIARRVIAEAFSNKVITPGVTTTTEVEWYLRERFEALQLRPWFQPYVNIQRRGDDPAKDEVFMGKYNRVILPGDIIHTDVGICYLSLCTDTQEMGYVLKINETDVPAGLQQAMAIGNQWQDILTSNFKSGLTGNRILANTIKQSEAANIISSTYTHPLGFVGHASGPTIGMWDNQGPTPIQGDWKLFPNTVYAIEGNIKTQLPEWDNQWIQIKLEQDAVFDGKKVWYLAGRQTQWHIIR